MKYYTNNSLFAKKEWPETARNILYPVRLLSFEPDPNIICAPRPGPGPSRPLYFWPTRRDIRHEENYFYKYADLKAEKILSKC
jgi:hypothetical protein